MRYLSLLLVAIVCMSPVLSAQSNSSSRLPHGIELEGDRIAFDQIDKGLSASGNVIATFKKFTVLTDSMYYNSGSGIIDFPEPLTIHLGDHTIDASHFHYNLKSYKGRSGDIKADISGMVIKGERIQFTPEKLIVHDAYFTSCEREDHRHYWMTAQKLLIYPQWGYIIMLRGGFHSDYLPFSVPVPTYLYGSRQYGLEGTRSLIPQIGTNKVEGFYVKSSLGYFRNPKSSGSILLGHAERVGMLVGWSHGYEFNEVQKAGFRVQTAGSDGFEGHVRYDVDFAKHNNDQPIGVLDEVLENFVVENERPLSRFSLLVQHQEIVNDVRVNYTPLLTFESNDLQLHFKKYKLTTLANFGKVSELRDDLRRANFPEADWTFQSWRSNVNPTLSREDRLAEHLTLYSDVKFNGYWYDTGQTWQRLYADAKFQWEFETFKANVGYTKLLMPIEGGSPFLHETQYSIESDEIGYGFEKQFSKFDLKAQHFYNLEAEGTRILDVTVGFKFHCYRIGFTWKLEQNAFAFGLDIF